MMNDQAQFCIPVTKMISSPTPPRIKVESESENGTNGEIKAPVEHIYGKKNYLRRRREMFRVPWGP